VRRPKAKAARAAREPQVELPDGAVLTEDALAVARAKGLADDEAKREWERLINWAGGANKTGRPIRRTKRGWDATWHNWCEEAVDRRGRYGSRPPRRSGGDVYEIARNMGVL
jgi:hypothetical protein